MNIDEGQLRKTAELRKLMRDPVTVLALIAEIENITGQRDRYRAILDAAGYQRLKELLGEPIETAAWVGREAKRLTVKIQGDLDAIGMHARSIITERDHLKAENETLRKELDARHPFKPFHEPTIGFTGCVICGVYTDHGGLPCPKTRAIAWPDLPETRSGQIGSAMGKGDQS